MDKRKVLNILGCVPYLLNNLLELAESSDNYTEFNILKNVPVIIGDEFEPLKYWKVNIFEKEEINNINMNIESKFALSVVGTRSKRVVFDFFNKVLGVNQHQMIDLIGEGTYISKTAHLGKGNFLGHQCIISSKVSTGFAVTIKRKCSIGHHTRIGDYVELNPGVTVGGGVYIGSSTMIGMGSVIRDKINIGNNSIIGMGSVVVKDIPANSLAIGNPCRVIKSLN